MKGIETDDLTGKVVLEIGSGRGSTTHLLVNLIAKYQNASLIVTDINNANFQKLAEEFKSELNHIRFIRTSACELENIDNGSVDYIVCNYALCAVNAQIGCGSLAVKRFFEVLKPGSKLLIEEEHPIIKRENEAQQIWSDKWRILKAALFLSGKFPYTEYSPEILADICLMAGFKNVTWESFSTSYEDKETLTFFWHRLKSYLHLVPNENLRNGLSIMADELQHRFERIGRMEVPYYSMIAEKL